MGRDGIRLCRTWISFFFSVIDFLVCIMIITSMSIIICSYPQYPHLSTVRGADWLLGSPPYDAGDDCDEDSQHNHLVDIGIMIYTVRPMIKKMTTMIKMRMI